MRLPGLNRVRVKDGADEAGEAGFDFLAARCVQHFHAATLATDQAVLAQDFEMLRERGFRDRLVRDRKEI